MIIYFLGKKNISRKNIILDSDFSEIFNLEMENSLVSSEFFDRDIISRKDFNHCSFTNISFKETEFKDINFLNCIFFNCYFRETKFLNVSFTGCKFIDCNFRKIKDNGGITFKFCFFENSPIKYEFINNCLPREASISIDIIQNLERESYRLGFYDEYLQYKKKLIKLREKDLKERFLRRDDWYCGHYNKKESFKAFLDWIVSKVSGYIWGYGESFFYLIISFLCITIIIWFLFIFFDSKNIQDINYLRVLLNILNNTFGSSSETEINLSQELVFLLHKIISILWVALLISLFNRRVLKK